MITYLVFVKKIGIFLTDITIYLIYLSKTKGLGVGEVLKRSYGYASLF